MKKLLYIIILVSSILTGCEEVIDVDLDTAPPRLVVDASIDWVKGTTGSDQVIKLTTTTGFYESAVPVVSDATVYITNNSTGNIYNFYEIPGTGQYTCRNFIPVVDGTYTLTVISGGQTYTAVETLNEVPEINRVAQSNEGGFLGEDVEVRFYFYDNPDQENYYLTRFDTNVLPYPEYDVMQDRFTNGNEMFNFISDEDLKAGEIVDIKFYGISKQYYNYMVKLLEIAGGGGPFSPPPGTIRGNIINETNESDYALGYFRVTQAQRISYRVQ